MKVHHVGYAVRTIGAAEPYFQMLGYEREGETTADDERRVKILFMRHGESGLRIELIEPMSDDSPAASWLKKNGDSSVPYHICYEVESVDRVMSELQKAAWFPISPVSPAPAIDSREVVFLYHPSAGVIELVGK